jgi:hypothetical protein
MSVSPVRFLRGEGRSRFLPSGASASHDVACVPASRRRVRGNFAGRAGRALALSIQVLRSVSNSGRHAAPEYEDVRMMFSIWELLSGVARFFRAPGR